MTECRLNGSCKTMKDGELTECPWKSYSGNLLISPSRASSDPQRCRRWRKNKPRSRQKRRTLWPRLTISDRSTRMIALGLSMQPARRSRRSRPKPRRVEGHGPKRLEIPVSSFVVLRSYSWVHIRIERSLDFWIPNGVNHRNAGDQGARHRSESDRLLVEFWRRMFHTAAIPKCCLRTSISASSTMNWPSVPKVGTILRKFGFNRSKILFNSSTTFKDGACDEERVVFWRS